jgi:hypothetical protein
MDKDIYCIIFNDRKKEGRKEGRGNRGGGRRMEEGMGKWEGGRNEKEIRGGKETTIVHQ